MTFFNLPDIDFRDKRQGIEIGNPLSPYTRSTRHCILMEVNFLFLLLLLFRVCPDLAPKWFKFDDGEVSECKMDDDEVLVTC